MRNLVSYTLIITIFNLSSVFGQNSDWRKEIENPNGDYLQIKNDAEQYFENNPSHADGNQYGFKDFIRWDAFWSKRAFKDGETTANFRHYRDGLMEYRSSVNNYCNTGDPSSWTSQELLNSAESAQGIIISVKADPNNIGTIYAGTNASGLYKSVDFGTSWQNVTDGFGMVATGISDIEIGNSGRIYISTGYQARGKGYGGALWYSDDGGNTWNTLYEFDQPNNFFNGFEIDVISKIKKNPHTGEIFMLASSHATAPNTGIDNFSGVWKFNEISNTIELLNYSSYSGSVLTNNSSIIKWPNNGDRAYWRDIEFHPTNPAIFYIASDDRGLGIGCIVKRSVNAGNTWETVRQVFDGGKLELAVSDDMPGNVYLSYAVPGSIGTYDAIIEKNDQSGISGNWNTLFSQNHSSAAGYGQLPGLGLGFFRNELEVSNSDADRIYWGGYFTHYSNDGGASFNIAGNSSIITPDNHVDVRAFDLASIVGNEVLIIGHDGGVSFYDHSTATISNANGNSVNTGYLDITQFYGACSSQQDPDLIYGGTQDNNAYVKDGGIWFRRAAGDVGTVATSPLDGDIVYSNSNLDLFYSKDRMQTRNAIEISDNRKLDCPVHVSPEGLFYVGTSELYRLDNPDPDIACVERLSYFINDFGIDGKMEAFDVNESDGNSIIIGFEGVEFQNVVPKKLFKTTDGGENWSNLSNSNISNLSLTIGDVLGSIPISCIESNPQNPNEIWIGMGGFASGNSGNAIKRVFYSQDGGITFDDISNGLPNFPINDIVYQNDSYGLLYLANDVGVYYWNAANSLWECFSENLPQTIITDLDINYTSNELVAATFGRGIWKSPILPQTNINPIVGGVIGDTPGIKDIYVYGNEVWNGLVTVRNNLHIMPGAELTLDNTNLELYRNSKIIVHRSNSTIPVGGKLIIKNTSTLAGVYMANDCEDGGYWQGIEVYGHPNESQFPLTASSQGYLRIESNSHIRDAQIGVLLGREILNPISYPNNPQKYSMYDFSYSGGILMCDDVKFTDNSVGVFFTNYSNFNPSQPGVEVDNASKIIESHFKHTTRDQLVSGAGPVSDHVRLLYVSGIDIVGNIFENASTFTAINFTDLGRGTGISSLNSSFNVEANCDVPIQIGTPCPSLNRNIFRYLTYGIEAGATDVASYVHIDNSEFKWCAVGAMFNGLSNVEFTRNEVSTRPSKDIDHSGLYLNQCTNLEIEENEFNRIDYQYANGPSASLVINRAGTQIEEIYNNSFNNINMPKGGAAMIIQGDPSQVLPTSGLKIKCNDFQTNELNNDEYLIAITQNGSISSLQGAFTTFNPLLPAGNTFNSNLTHNICSIPGDREIEASGSASAFTYHHHIESSSNKAVEPICYTATNISTVQSTAPYLTKTAACPSLLSSGLDPIVIKPQIELNIGLRDQAIELIDGNRTEEIITYILSDPPAGELHDTLMLYSPYLSDKVLKTIFDKPTQLPTGIIKQILSSNSPLSDNIKELYVSLGLPPGVDNQLDEQQNGSLSEMDKLESEIEYYNTLVMRGANDLIRHYIKNDTLSGAKDSAIYYMKTYWEVNPYSRCRIASVMMSMGDTATAHHEIDSALNKFPGNQYCILQELLFELENNLEKCVMLSNPERTIVENVLYSDSVGCVNANVILNKIDSVELPPIVYFPIPGSNKILIFEDNELDNNNLTLKIYPNPAENVINISSNQSGLLYIYNIDGQIINQSKITTGVTSLTIDNIPSGIYHVNLVTPSGQTRNSKLIVIH